jgi:hypothetical protein
MKRVFGEITTQFTFPLIDPKLSSLFKYLDDHFSVVGSMTARVPSLFYLPCFSQLVQFDLTAHVSRQSSSLVNLI